MVQGKSDGKAGHEEQMSTRPLKAGPFSVELEDGNLRNIRWHDKEAIRAISYLVRDTSWGNHALEISSLKVEQNTADFSVRYQAHCSSDSGVRLDLDVHIYGSESGVLIFKAEAVPAGSFLTNRCGFCVLHPIVGVAGHPVTIEHTNGHSESSCFPLVIDPAQPFFDIRSIRHELSPGMTVSCRMDGGTFEMEDQRNWSDASYKTYVRPLALPWPYALEGGVPISQTVTIQCNGEPEIGRRSERQPEMLRLSIGPFIGQVPPFGLGIRPADLKETLYNVEILKLVAPQQLILAFNPLEGDNIAVLEDYARLLSAFPAEATLEYVLSCKGSPASELEHLAQMVKDTGLNLAAIAVSPAPDLKSTPPGSTWHACPPLSEIYTAARQTFPDMRIGGGMFSYFTELNRKRPPCEQLDFITHTTSPLVHAADDRSVMETLEALTFITASVRTFAGDMPYRIGPSSIGMRSNPYGASLNANPEGRRITMTAHDPRQKTKFAAAWMIGYAAATAGASLAGLALGSLAGPFGILDAGARTPAFEAAAWLSGIAGTASRRVESSHPGEVLALCGGDIVLIANLTPATKTVFVDDHMRLELGPYGIARQQMAKLA